MSYILYNSDGSIAVIIPDNTVDSVSTSLDLVGKNLDKYGEYLNSNFFKLLTNFASLNTEEPRSPKIGQLWYDMSTNRIKVFNGDEFVYTVGTKVAGTPPAVDATGDLWYDSINGQLKIWDGNSYQLIGPSVSKIYGKFNVEPPPSTILSDDQNIEQKVGILYSYSKPAAVITTASFIMKATDSFDFLDRNSVTNIEQGISVKDNLVVFKDFSLYGNIRSPVRWLSSNFDITSYGDITDNTINTSTRLNMYYDANNAIRFELIKLFPKNSNFDNIYNLYSEAKVLCNLTKTVAISSTTALTQIGTSTLSISTSSLSVGLNVISDYISKTTTIVNINQDEIELSSPTLIEIPQGTVIKFNEDIKSVRKFKLEERISGNPQWEPDEIYPSTSSESSGTCVLLGSSLEAKIINVSPTSILNELAVGMQIVTVGTNVGNLGTNSLITNIDLSLNEITFISETTITAGTVNFSGISFPYINTFTNIVR